MGLVKEKKDNTPDAAEAAKDRTVPPASFQRKDTLYCTQTKKQHGWLMPMDTISKEYASHRNLSFRFTHRYPSGYWGKMEVVDAYGNLRTGGLTPYILKVDQADSDTEANTNWVEKLKTCSVYELIADPSGKDVVQERVYDKEGNIVYTYSRVPIGEKDGKRRYIGSYKDCFGLPAEMRKDSLYTYGTLVRLTEDRWGNDSIVEYMDSKGKPKLNSERVAMEVYICDGYGHLLKQQSRDAEGNLTIDNWGNCGIEYGWAPGHRNVSVMYMDDKWQPMRMPDRRGVGNSFGVIKTLYQYDCYGRLTEMAYFTEHDVPDSNAFGIHRIAVDYDGKGNMTGLANYDILGNLVEDAYGAAVQTYRYDDAGRCLEIVLLDKNRKPLANSYNSRFNYEYDQDGNKVLEEYYAVVDGRETLVYKEEKGRDYTYLLSNGIVCIDSLDVEGRLVRKAYYDPAGNPVKNPSSSYAVMEVKYTGWPDGYRSVTSFYDENRKPEDSKYDYAVNVEVNDTVSRLSRFYYYDADGNLMVVYIHKYDDKNTVLGQYDANAYGIICRAGGSSSARLYKADVNYSVNGAYSTFVGRDEFGEPDYISTPGVIYYYTKMSVKGNNLNMDENSRVIDDPAKFKDECPKMMTIEVIDSTAYRLGIRDNDIILFDGEYAADIFAVEQFPTSYYDFRMKWALHSVLDGSAKRDMIVFRVNPETLEYGLVKIPGLQGSPSELGYLAHIRYLTRKQLKRIQACVRENLDSDTPLFERKSLLGQDYSGLNRVLMAFSEMYRSERSSLYGRQVADPSVVLAACMKESETVWETGDDISAFKKILNARGAAFRKSPSRHFYLTRNGKDIIDLVQEYRKVDADWFEAYVSDDAYALLTRLSEQAGSAVSREMADDPELKRKDLMDDWILKDKDDNTICMSFGRKGRIKGFIEKKDTLGYIEGVDIIHKIRKTFVGEWSVSGRYLRLVLTDKGMLTSEFVKLTGGGSQLVEKARSFLENVVKNFPHYLNNKMNMDVESSGNIRVISLSEDSLVLDDDSAEGLVFRRLSKDDLKK